MVSYLWTKATHNPDYLCEVPTFSKSILKRVNPDYRGELGQRALGPN
jgi:hypothetical protein